MKKFFTLIAAALMSAGASAAETQVTSWTFDDATSPTLVSSGTGTAADYTHAAVVGDTNGKFLNAWRANATSGSLQATITTENLTEAAKWVLEFDFAGFSGCNKNVGVATIADAEGNAILTITDAADWGNTFALSDGNTIACYPCERTNRGSANTGNQLTATYWHHFTITGGASGIKMNVARYNADGTLGSNVISKSQLSSANATPSSISIQAGSWGSMGIDNLKLVTSDEADVVYNYTVKYVDNETGDEIKTASVRSDDEGATISLTSNDVANFFSEDGTIKYLYLSDDAANKIVAADGSTVVTVAFKKAGKNAYTVNAEVGNETILLESGEVFDEETVTYGYPRYMVSGGVLYEAAVTNKEYRGTFVPTANANTATVTYSNKDVENVTFLAEGENIEGFDTSVAGNIPVRGSNAKAGVSTEDITITALAAGKYKFVVGAFTSKTSQQNLNFKAGQTEFTASSSGNLAEYTSDEINIKENEELVFLGTTSSVDAQLDYIYIQRTGDYKYLDVESTLPDTLTYVKGTAEEEKPKLSDYIKVSTNALKYGAAFYVAKVEAGADKAAVEYTEYKSENAAKAAMSDPGLYYAFGRIIGVFSMTDMTDYQEVFTDTIVVEIKEAEAEPVSAHTWDFTQLSDVTITNLKADAAASKTEGWSDVEKKATADANGEPTELSKDNCFWFAGTANADGELEANGELIEELSGLTFPTTDYNSARSIAIAVNYKDLQVYDDQGQVTGSAGFGPYNGASYLWLGGKDKDCFVIKNVKVGTTITMGVESHKLTDARGVKLMLDGTELKDPDGNAVAAPTVYAEQTWLVPYPASALSAKGGALSADADDEVVDITVHNTNGCHIYFIDAEIGEPTPTAISSVEEEAEAVKTAKFFENGQIIIVKDGKKFNAAGAVLK